jgi:hypothetical protein
VDKPQAEKRGLTRAAYSVPLAFRRAVAVPRSPEGRRYRNENPGLAVIVTVIAMVPTVAVITMVAVVSAMFLVLAAALAFVLALAW